MGERLPSALLSFCLGLSPEEGWIFRETTSPVGGAGGLFRAGASNDAQWSSALCSVPESRESADAASRLSSSRRSSLLLERPGMKGGAPLATFVHQHISPVTANFLASGVGLPPAVGVAKLAFLLASLHRYLMALDPALDKASEQRLSPLLSSNLLAPGWKNDGGLGVALRHLRRVARTLSHCEAAAAAWLLKSWENAASAVSIPTTTNRHLRIGFIVPSFIGRSILVRLA